MITIELPQDLIDEIFEEAKEQADYVFGLYKAIMPVDWETIANLNHSPQVSNKTNEYIFGKAIEFDREHHPDVINGGAWMSMGFGPDRDVDVDWVVVIDDDAITYKED